MDCNVMMAVIKETKWKKNEIKENENKTKQEKCGDSCMVTIRAIACPPQEILPAANTWEAAIGYETAASRGFQPIV